MSFTSVWEKESELATTSLEFEYLHWKSQCEMLIGGDDISNDVITLGTWLVEIWQLRQRGAAGELELEFKFQEHSSSLSFLFPPCCQSAQKSLLTG